MGRQASGAAAEMARGTPAPQGGAPTFRSWLCSSFQLTRTLGGKRWLKHLSLPPTQETWPEFPASGSSLALPQRRGHSESEPADE